MKDKTIMKTDKMKDKSETRPFEALVSVLDDYGNKIVINRHDVSNCEDDYPKCHCNNCIEDIQKMNGIEKGRKYFNKSENQNVIVESFCPLPYCADVFWNTADGKGKQYGWSGITDLHEAH